MFRDVECILTSAQERNSLINEVTVFETRFGVKVKTFEEIRPQTKSTK
jgi:hypothetical protein